MVDLAPDEGPPPRHVDAWTRVAGHVVVRGPRGNFCSCGWSAAADDHDPVISEHLRDAWPVLVPRVPGEPLHLWRDRVAATHGEALKTRERLWHEHRMGDPIQPGQPFPMIPDEWATADCRVQVLEHQLETPPLLRVYHVVHPRSASEDR